MEQNVRKDSRFVHISKDPRFKRVPKSERKVRIDKRFQSMFNDDKFKLKYTVDKRGRPEIHSTNEDLNRFYELPSDESDSDSEEDKSEDGEGNESLITSKKERVTPGPSKPDDGCDLEADEEDAEPLSAAIKDKLHSKVDYARGDAKLLSDSSSDEESSENDSETELRELEHGWGELDHDAEKTDEITNRLAVCNMDWDRMRTSDLMVLFNSFLPPGGLIRTVTIYPSEFGLERMKQDDVSGPVELLNDPNETATNLDKDGLPCDDENEEGQKFHMEKLRQYQLTRLKYYYAVIVFDSPETANKVYTVCDGIEYESSSTRLDLRFIPDDTTFDQEPRETCDSMPDPSKYKPRYFTTTALQQAKVDLTWDETDPRRSEITQKIAAGTADDADLHAYLASSSGEDEKEDGGNSSSEEEGTSKPLVDPIAKYRALLSGIEDAEESKKNRGVEMEVTWGLDLKKKAQKLVAKKIKDGPDGPTPFEQMLERRKENRKKKQQERRKKNEPKDEDKDTEDDDQSSDDDIPSDIDMNDPYFKEELEGMSKTNKAKKKKKKYEDVEEDEETKQKKAELELLVMGDDDGRQHFSLKQIQEAEAAASGSKKKRRKMKWKKEVAKPTEEDNFEIDVKDDRFSALFSSHHYNIDPADPHYRKTKAMEKLRTEKLNRRAGSEEVDVDQAPKKKSKKPQETDLDLSQLVKIVKRKVKGKFNN